MAEPPRRNSRANRGPAAAVPGSVLSGDERKKLIEIALDLIEGVYVHLPLKRSMYAVNPVQRLRLLRRRLDTPKTTVSDREFFNEVLSIFSDLRDLHTNFILPEPFRSSTAYLPFRLQKCQSSGQESYVVAHVIPGHSTDTDFQRGAIVTHWNGTPIHLAVAANADREAGSNPAARQAQGLAALTMRWLGQSLLPDEEWVELQYLPQPKAKAKTIRLEWQVFRRQAGAAATAIARAQKDNVWGVGMDARAESERQVRRHLFDEGRKQAPRVKHFGDETTSMPEWAREVFPTCGNVQTSAGVFAYVRLATFNVDRDGPFIGEFIRIVSQLSQDGLILDVRGNGGGLIHFGERLLQVLTPRSIDPARFSFLNSIRTQGLAVKNKFIHEWRDSIAQSVETGAEYSQGFPLLPIGRYNDIGQKYQGPVVLITDALCYSATDIFAAGFQDHHIGVILGVDENTGAGGANVWEYALLASLLQDPIRFPPVLPASASFRFAVRRVTRVGKNSGVPLEDLGVQPDKRHRMTRRDLLERNIDLIEKAAKILHKQQVQRLTANLQSKGKVQVSYQNLDRIDAYLHDRPLESLDVTRSAKSQQQSLTLRGNKSSSPPRVLRLEGFRTKRPGQDELVAATRLSW